VGTFFLNLLKNGYKFLYVPSSKGYYPLLEGFLGGLGGSGAASFGFLAGRPTGRISSRALRDEGSYKASLVMGLMPSVLRRVRMVLGFMPVFWAISETVKPFTPLIIGFFRRIGERKKIKDFYP
jgi:hypothetical protein